MQGETSFEGNRAEGHGERHVVSFKLPYNIIGSAHGQGHGLPWAPMGSNGHPWAPMSLPKGAHGSQTQFVTLCAKACSETEAVELLNETPVTTSLHGKDPRD